MYWMVARPLEELLSFSRAANIFQRNSQDLLPTHSPHTPLQMNSTTLYLGHFDEFHHIAECHLIGRVNVNYCDHDDRVNPKGISHVTTWGKISHFTISKYAGPGGINASPKLDVVQMYSEVHEVSWVAPPPP